MKVSSVILTLATTGSLVAAGPHHHRHRHEKRVPDAVSYVTVCEVSENGQQLQISQAECEEGIKNGTLKYTGGVTKPPPSKPADEGQQLYAKPQPTSSTSTSTSAAPAPPTATPASSPASTSSSGGQGVTLSFPDGEVDCSEFPGQYGAVPVPWENLNGYSGVQQVTFGGDSITNIVTITNGGCQEGCMCSYACPVGYQKAQWPEAQGSTGQSVGGLQCKNNKLHKPDGSTSEYLCIPSAGGVFVENDTGKSLPICRTDYPGTESETIPANFDPSSASYELACPDEDSYYHWQGKKRDGGKPTSAQYYVNPLGTPLEKACTWGAAGSNEGNWAPVNLGCGKKDGTNWLSILANSPTNPSGTLAMVIEIVGDVSGKCSYSGGQYYQDGIANSLGCTVASTGKATFKFSA